LNIFPEGFAGNANLTKWANIDGVDLVFSGQLGAHSHMFKNQKFMWNVTAGIG
jgi:hypothetical protein